MAKRTNFSIILPTEKTSASDVLTTGTNVNDGMGKNTEVFPSPTVPLKELKDAVDALKKTSEIPKKDQSQTTDDLLQEQKFTVIKLLKKLSVYVLMVADGDRYKAGLSGFKLTVEETKSHKPSAFKVTSTPGPGDGEVTLEVSDRAGNVFFLVELKTESGWVLMDGFNTLIYVLAGLPSGSSTLRITGKKGKVKSPPVEIVVKAF